MRKKIVAGNWKMNLTFQEGIALVDAVLSAKPDLPPNLEVYFAASSLYLRDLNDRVSHNPNIVLGAQNMNGHISGAFTGEISTSMLKSVGIRDVLIGHSERRSLFDENLQMIETKVYRGLQDGFNVMLAVGEQRAIRESGRQMEIVLAQIDSALLHYKEEYKHQLTIAYEPVWAIGTGLSATPEQVQEMHSGIRKHLSDNFPGLGVHTSILYGGSVKPSNAEEIFSQPDVDGALIGGASLKADSFIEIIDIMENIL